jgi:bifunctional non-homologous end joining protein LigD
MKTAFQRSAAAQARARAVPAAQSESAVAGVRLSHPDKLLFPEAGLSKLDLARYYEAVAERMLPHVKGRPLSLFRCPDGWSRECFFQKHAGKGVHEALRRVQAPESGGTATYLCADTLAALVGLVQWGVIEIHPWGSRMPRPERPDVLIFDFDPADDVPWARLVEAVKMLQALLEELGLAAFLKTTGGKGLHVVTPIKPALDWSEAKDFTRSVAELFMRTAPERFTVVASKNERRGRIFIDYLRNAEGATAVAPYGIRARNNAPVATPIAWKELARDLRFDYFTVKNVPQRLRRQSADPWEGFEAERRSVTKAMMRKLPGG